MCLEFVNETSKQFKETEEQGWERGMIRNMYSIREGKNGSRYGENFDIQK